MHIRTLTYLTALAREQHFARAAAACNVTQPTLSAGLRTLEEELGVTLVKRGRRFEGLTAEGHRVLAWAERILAESEALRQDLSAQGRDLAGHLRLGVIPSALAAAAQVTAPLLARHPRLRVSVLSVSSTELARKLAHFELDAGITYLENEPVGPVRSVPLYHEDYVLLTQADGALAHRQTLSWREAASLPLCLLVEEMQNRRIVDGIFRSIGCAPEPAVQTNSIVALCAHVQAGPWSSVVPRALLDTFGTPPGTRALALVEPEVSKTVGLVVADREPQAPLIRALLGLAASLQVQAVPRSA
ncbi:LysR family transcriptional regulator [Zavarzinia sp. CC-PAN008]|uniref:LysR family transcriptional regulator n=1 Tax=Zavarzinia sp. CC-PAN008 TaxID=3243332 RepID=UPI003F746B19